ncbi:MAG: iron chelate uptake ABC transporter family permease subunit [Candidatus Hinthialibacter antarcticus]|nr:iron chelate uptake ABC transporter family permease subunit [Candidatus Hinthialibacter antarcticus]
MNFLTDINAQWVLAGCVLLGICSGILSSFAMLRKRSLLGDALAHSALPGVCVAYLIVGERSIPAFMLGALAAGMLGAFCIQFITRHSRIKEDAALGLVLSVFFAVGIVLLTYILNSSGGNKAGLKTFIFGQAASMIGRDVYIMASCAIVVIVFSLLLYKEMKLLCFDVGFADSLGYSSTWLDALLNILIVLVVVIGLQAVGVVLMVAMLITPAAAARYWTDRLNRMTLLSALFGGLSGALGVYLSALAPRMPTGPWIVLSATLMFILSLLFAPARGLLAKGLRTWSLRSRVARENALRSLYEWSERKNGWDDWAPLEDIASMRSQSHAQALRNLRGLKSNQFVEEQSGAFRLTKDGQEQAYQVTRNHRLWEMYLMYEEEFDADHVDRDADFIEHFLTPETVKELERLLDSHKLNLKQPPTAHPIATA